MRPMTAAARTAASSGYADSRFPAARQRCDHGAIMPGRWGNSRIARRLVCKKVHHSERVRAAPWPCDRCRSAVSGTPGPRGGGTQGRTRVLKRRSRSAAGSAVIPAWTGPGWTIADRGAVSQRNRSPRGCSASGPSVQARPNALSAARTAATSAPGSSAAGGSRQFDPRPEVAERLGVQEHPGVDRLTAVDPRDHADQGVLEDLVRLGGVWAHDRMTSGPAGRG